VDGGVGASTLAASAPDELFSGLVPTEFVVGLSAAPAVSGIAVGGRADGGATASGEEVVVAVSCGAFLRWSLPIKGTEAAEAGTSSLFLL